MKKQWFIGMMAWVMGLPAIAHVWDELAILARPNNEGTFTLEKYSFLQPTTYTNAVFFDFDNDENLDLLIMGQGGDWNISGDIKFVTLYRNLGPDEDFRFERTPVSCNAATKVSTIRFPRGISITTATRTCSS